jgi:hypothetical protein
VQRTRAVTVLVTAHDRSCQCRTNRVRATRNADRRRPEGGRRSGL